MDRFLLAILLYHFHPQVGRAVNCNTSAKLMLYIFTLHLKYNNENTQQLFHDLLPKLMRFYQQSAVPI